MADTPSDDISTKFIYLYTRRYYTFSGYLNKFAKRTTTTFFCLCSKRFTKIVIKLRKNAYTLVIIIRLTNYFYNTNNNELFFKTTTKRYQSPHYL